MDINHGRIIPPQDDVLAQALHRANAEQAAQQQMAMILQQALGNPHTVRRYNVSAAQLVHDGDQPMLHVGLLSGERLEIPLSPQALTQISRAAQAGESDSE